MPPDSNATARGRSCIGYALIALGATALIAACSTSPHTVKPPANRTLPAATTSAASTPASAPGLSGTWSGTYSGAYQGTFTLVWQQKGSNLGGTIKISNPPGTLTIHGTVNKDAIRFGTVGSIGITYSGTVSGNSMSGSYQVQGASGSSGGPWSASKTSG